jgi:hypothetical protein
MRFDIACLLHGFWRWWADAQPWLQGLFGGAGALLLWEGVLKPKRERRALAHALAEELSHNLQYAVGQRLYLEHNPKSIPMDFELSEIVFSAVRAKFGELRPHVGAIMLVYRQIQALNKLPAAYKETLLRYNAENTTIPEVNADPSRGGRIAELDRELNSMLGVYKSGLEVIVGRVNTLLPRLRRAAVPLWRLDYYLRPKKLLSITEAAENVATLAAQRKRELEGK